MNVECNRRRQRAGVRSVRALIACVTVWMALATSTFAAEPVMTEVVVNAPIETVWRNFTTAEGYELMGAARADIDLRIGGRLRTHGDPKGMLGDEHGTEWEILAYDPRRMLVTRPVRVPAGFAQREALLRTWNVTYFSSIAGATTHVRVVMLGWGDDAASREARQAAEQRIGATLERLVKRYRPACAHCERPQ